MGINMIRDTNFWISIIVFQVVFGLAVFGITRQYYIQDSGEVSANPTAPRPTPLILPERLIGTNTLPSQSSGFNQATTQDPLALARQADEFFANQQYNSAAELYERMLARAPGDVNTYNNLGITLHYLGRSAEALAKLNEGIVVDPTYQRIWLTLGFVNGQLGNTEQARTALRTAAQMGADNEVGQSALDLLANLP